MKCTYLKYNTLYLGLFHNFYSVKTSMIKFNLLSNIYRRIYVCFLFLGDVWKICLKPQWYLWVSQKVTEGVRVPKVSEKMIEYGWTVAKGVREELCNEGKHDTWLFSLFVRELPTFNSFSIPGLTSNSSSHERSQ